MPYRSESQRRYMNWAAGEGKIKQSVVDEYNEASKGKHFPEKVGKKKFSKLRKHMGIKDE